MVDVPDSNRRPTESSSVALTSELPSSRNTLSRHRAYAAAVPRAPGGHGASTPSARTAGSRSIDASHCRLSRRQSRCQPAPARRPCPAPGHGARCRHDGSALQRTSLSCGQSMPGCLGCGSVDVASESLEFLHLRTRKNKTPPTRIRGRSRVLGRSGSPIFRGRRSADGGQQYRAIAAVQAIRGREQALSAACGPQEDRVRDVEGMRHGSSCCDTSRMRRRARTIRRRSKHRKRFFRDAAIRRRTVTHTSCTCSHQRSFGNACFVFA